MSSRSSDRHGRTPEEIKRHYDVEKELANLLRSAGREERPGLYGRLYAELFRRVPDHPSLKVDTAPAINSLRGQMLFLRRFLNSDATLMEIGSGTCMLSLEAAKHVKKVYAIDVEDQTSKSARKPDNFQLIIYEGIDIPLPEGSVNIAYSNQMIEHLHPDDALALTQDIYRVLAPGGIYVCSSPNRLA